MEAEADAEAEAKSHLSFSSPVWRIQQLAAGTGAKPGRAGGLRVGVGGSSVPTPPFTPSLTLKIARASWVLSAYPSIPQLKQSVKRTGAGQLLLDLVACPLFLAFNLVTLASLFIPGVAERVVQQQFLWGGKKVRPHFPKKMVKNNNNSVSKSVNSK